MEVIALLAKQDLSPRLEATLSRRDEDRILPRPARSIQKQHRLSPNEVHELARQYEAGATALELAHKFGVHRTTVLAHLEHQGIDRRRYARRLTDTDIAHAARLYKDGRSLRLAAAPFDVDAETLRREFKKAGVPTRPRRGWANAEHS